MAQRTNALPTRAGQIITTRNRFEYDIVRGKVPPYYFDKNEWENINGVNYRNFDLPYSAGSCRVSWSNDQFNFEWR